MRPVTVAISDIDRSRRTRNEHALRDVSDVTLLTNVTAANGAEFTTRRLKPRTNITIIEDEVARVRRLKPRVLLVDLSLCQDSDENCIMLKSLHHECPATLAVLVGEEAGNEDLIIKALEAGARGYLSYEAVHQHLAKVASVVNNGEVWVSRKMLGKVMDRVQGYELH